MKYLRFQHQQQQQQIGVIHAELLLNPQGKPPSLPGHRNRPSAVEDVLSKRQRTNAAALAVAASPARSHGTGGERAGEAVRQ